MIIDFCWIMKIGVYSNCTIDRIILKNQEYEQAGGAGCYCGLTSKNLKNDVSLHTNFGNCLLYTSPSPRDGLLSRMPSSA